jgi:probable HAF family extracellular repeat protein
MQRLNAPGTLESLARSINDSGQAVGFLSVDRSNQWYAFLWDPNVGMQNLGLAQFGPTSTCSINNQGFVVGQFGSAEDRTRISTWTREGGARRLDSRGVSMQVAGLDDAGRFAARAEWTGFKVLGFGSASRSTSYLWDPNLGLREIQYHLGRRDVVEFVAADINNKGQIAGRLRLKNGPDVLGVVLEPIE